MVVHSPDADLQDLIRAESSYIAKCLRRALHVREELSTSNGVCAGDGPAGSDTGPKVICNESVEVNGKPLTVVFHKID